MFSTSSLHPLVVYVDTTSGAWPCSVDALRTCQDILALYGTNLQMLITQSAMISD